MTSPQCADDSFKKMIDDVVIDELPTSKWEKLRKHLQGCLTCRSRYNKAVLASRMLAGGPQAIGTPSPAELNRIERAVLDGHEPKKSAFGRMLSWFAPAQRWGTGLALTAAALAIIPLLRMNEPTSGRDEFQPRGGKDKGPVELFSKTPVLKPTERSAGLRAFCLVGDKVEALDQKDTKPPRCARSAQLKLAVSNTGKYSKVFLVGLDKDYDLKWYAPRPPETESVNAPAPGQDKETAETTVETPVGASVRLVVNHGPGVTRIFGIFSDKPVTVAEVEAAAKTAKDKKVGLSDLYALPFSRTDVLQRSLLIDIGE
jgi:hypothetical protein